MSDCEAAAIYGLESQPMRLLIAAARDRLTGARTADGIRLDDSDWREMAALANRHGMTAWLHETISRRADVPPDAAIAIADDARGLATDSLRATRELLEIVGALGRADVPALAVKGPALSWWLYGTTARRRFTDLDVVVPPARAEAALTALARRGYELPVGVTRASSRVVYAGRSAWPLTRAGSFPIDLHWRFADVSFAVPLSVTRAFGQASSIDVAGGRLRVPSPTHTAALTFAHAAKHGWCTLEILATLAHLLQRTDVNWPEVRRLFEDAGTSSALIAGARLVETSFGLELPAALTDRGGQRATDRLATLARVALELPAGVHLNRWQERRLHRACVDRRIDRLRYEALRLVMPTPLDAAWCRVPDSLAFCYAPLRLLRLTVQTLGVGLDASHVSADRRTFTLRRRRAFPR